MRIEDSRRRARRNRSGEVSEGFGRVARPGPASSGWVALHDSSKAAIVNAEDVFWCLDDHAHLVMVLATGKTGAVGVEPTPRRGSSLRAAEGSPALDIVADVAETSRRQNGHAA